MKIVFLQKQKLIFRRKSPEFFSERAAPSFDCIQQRIEPNPKDNKGSPVQPFRNQQRDTGVKLISQNNIETISILV